MRIALFHLGFFYSGGGEKLILEEMRGLKASGHEVDCFAPYVNREECYPDVPEMKQVRSLLPPPPSWLPMKDAIWLTLSCLVIPLTAWRFRSYDVLFGANQPAPWYAFVLSKILQKPYVIYLAQPLRLLHPRRVDHENGIRIREGDHRFLVLLRKLAGKVINWADRISVRNAQIVLTNGVYVSRWISEIYEVPNVVCSAGCHPQQESQIEYEVRWQGTVRVNGTVIPKPFILLTNRHSPQKKFEYALWALKRIGHQVPNISLVITGQETSYTEQLRYLADGLNLSEKVHFIGLVSEEKLQLLYSEAALYVYPAPEEDFGMGIIEAMAAGTPVIAWNNAGPSNIVLNRKTGFLITPYDTEEFSMRMLELASNPSLVERMGHAAFVHAKDKYSYQRHNEILLRAFSYAVEAYQEGRRAQTHVREPLTKGELEPSVDSQERMTVTEKISQFRIGQQEVMEYFDIDEY
jgi:glycosyltransferase involved in cell wall biosynthesis